jgi:hypothetical protein
LGKLASPAGDCFTGSKGTRLLFGDEVSFAQWGSLGYTWALKGQPPVVKTTGKRKGYKVLGLIELFSGRFFYHGQEERFWPKCWPKRRNILLRLRVMSH